MGGPGRGTRERALRWLLSITLLAAGLQAGLPVREGNGSVEKVGPLLVADGMLAERTRSLALRSASWAAGLDSLEATGFRVLVSLPEQAPRLVPALAGYEPQHLGEVIPLRDNEGALIGAVVTVDVAALERMAARLGAQAGVVASDAERILIHEIYGHVVPLARTRRLADGCPDPSPGEPATASCAIVRENLVRAELGLPARERYDLSALTLGTLAAGR